MFFSRTALVAAVFATAAICAPVTYSDRDVSGPVDSLATRDTDYTILARAQSKAQLTQAYHAAEDDAKSALASAKSMDSSLKGKTPTAADTAKMKAYILTAYRSGHQAEKVRGDWMTQYGGSSMENVDLGHANAVQWIDSNIMQPTEALAKTWNVSL